ncbi:MAG TPA: hypothetical protein VK149_04155 [Sideroxyarcus sp.]|nr:hypothetical protein [Sideroxyarcus sp.]
MIENVEQVYPAPMPASEHVGNSDQLANMWLQWGDERARVRRLKRLLGIALGAGFAAGLMLMFALGVLFGLAQ